MGASHLRDQIASHYILSGAVSFGSFELAGGGWSDIYIDGRLVTTKVAALRTIAKAMAGLILERRLLGPQDSLVAPVVSGVPVAVAVGLELEIDYVMDRGRAKAHGSGRRFEGDFKDGKCLVVDDLITVGSTILSTAEALHAVGKTVTDVIVIVDRQEGGAEELKRHGITLHSLLTKDELVKHADGGAA
jgi:orotate phosphoribosyltransferase